MAQDQVKVEGVPELVRALRRAGDVDSLDALKQAHATGAGLVMTTAAPLIPRGETMRLVSSLRASATPRAGYVRTGRATVPYAGVIHFGWPQRNIRPQPWLYDALDSRADEVLAAFERAVQQIADGVDG